LDKVRKKAKLTKTAELEAELAAYKTESLRLKGLLDTKIQESYRVPPELLAK
jgi:hypothetical protein